MFYKNLKQEKIALAYPESCSNLSSDPEYELQFVETECFEMSENISNYKYARDSFKTEVQS